MAKSPQINQENGKRMNISRVKIKAQRTEDYALVVMVSAWCNGGSGCVADVLG